MDVGRCLHEIALTVPEELTYMPVLCAPAQPSDAVQATLGCLLPSGTILIALPKLSDGTDCEQLLSSHIPKGYQILGSGVQIGIAGIAEITHLHYNTARSYYYQGQIPAPDGTVSNSPWWWHHTIDTWNRNGRPASAHRTASTSQPMTS